MTTPELSDEQLRAIGRISVKFSFLEFLVKICIMHLLGTDNDRATVVTAQMPFRQLVDTFVRPYRRRFPMQEKELSPAQRATLVTFKEMVKRIDKAGEDRNRIVHFWWEPEGFTGKAFGQGWSKRGRAWFQPTFVKMTSAELDGIADRIGAVSEKVRGFSDELGVERERLRHRKEGPPPAVEQLITEAKRKGGSG